ncbi:MAG: hypothetical protein LBR50_08355 [Tannerella sp.]|jgi:hypothetical protein|nr:hypothetical protein [Tannerella sp.]
MEKKVVEMSQTEYKRFMAFKEADKIVRGIKRGLREVHEARLGRKKLKSARELAYEL